MDRFLYGWLCGLGGGVVVGCSVGGGGELVGCDEYPRVESGMLVLKGEQKGNGTKEAEGGIVYLNWCTNESARGTVPELTMRDISTW